MLISAGSTFGMRLRPMGVPFMHPMLRGGVPHVVELGPGEEVRRSGTGRVIAVVQDREPIRKRPVLKFPGDAVGVDPNVVQTDLAVAASGACSDPDPAGAEFGAMLGDRPSLVHSGPEAGEKSRGILIEH